MFGYEVLVQTWAEPEPQKRFGFGITPNMNPEHWVRFRSEPCSKGSRTGPWPVYVNPPVVCS